MSPIHDSEELDRQQEEGQKLSKQIIQEGAALVKNDGDVLPLNKEANRKVNVFGHSCVDWGFGGSGSVRVRPENDDLKKAIFKVNDCVANHLNEIEKFINDIPQSINGIDIMSNKRKEYYFKTFKIRFETILQKHLQ